MNKRKVNTNTGITLVALILSVVILIVIASITIGAIKDEPILENSQTAVKQFSELQFREELEAIFLSYTSVNQRGLKINNKKITNKILNIFDYPNINTETGELLDEEEGATELYTMTAEEGYVNVTNNSNSETILEVTYNKDNNLKFSIIYKDSVYEYENYKLEKINYCINNNAADWKYNTLSDGTISITKCKLTDLNNIIIPKYLIDEKGNKLTVTSLGDNKFSMYSQGTSALHIADFKGTVILPNDVTLQRYAFYGCPNIEKIVFGENNVIVRDNGGAHQFTSVNTKLKEVKIGEGSTIIYNTFDGCPNIENVVVEDKARLLSTSFYNCGIDNIEIGDNVKVEGRAFWKCTKKIEKILIGDNFVSLGKWLESSSVKDIIIGKNVSLGSHGLSAQSTISIDRVVIDKTILNLGSFALYTCNISSPNNYIEIVAKDGNELVINAGALIISSDSSIKKIVLDGTDGSIKLAPDTWQVVSTNKTMELKGNINSTSGYGPFRNANDVIVSENAVIGENVISRSKLNTLIINKNATISNIGGEVSKVIIKDISEWDEEKLIKIKEVIAASIKKTPIQDETLDTLTYTK